MADDPINIVVADNVDPNVESKILAIGVASDKSSASLLALKAALASIQSDALTTLREQANSVTQSINAELNAAKQMAETANAVATATNNLSTATKNVRADADAATASIKAQTDATNALKDAQSRPATIIGDSGPLPQGTRSATGAIGKAQAEADAVALASAASAAGKASREAEADVEALSTKGAGFFSRFKSAGASAFDAIRDAITGNGTRFKAVADDIKPAAEAIESVGSKSYASSFQLVELARVVKDLGTGQFTMAARSGLTLATTFKAVQGAILPLIGVAVAGFLAVKVAQHELNTESEKTSLKNYAESLGLTTKEMRKLSDTTVDASGKLKEHNDLQITAGDVLKGTFQTIKDEIMSYGGDTFSKIGESGKKAFTDIGNKAVEFGKDLYAVLIFVRNSLNDIGDYVHNKMMAAFGDMVGVIGTALQNVINTIIHGFNEAGEFLNKVLHTDAFGKAADVAFATVKSTSEYTEAAAKAAGNLGNEWSRAKSEAASSLGSMNSGIKTLKNNIDDAARARIKAAADAIKANRNPTKGRQSDPKTKDDFLDDENKKLDDQIKRFGMLKDAREAQQQLDQVEEAFIKRRMPLNAAEIQQFRDKINFIQQNNKVQADMDKIYNDINGPAENYRIAQKAINELLSRGYIDQSQYNQQMDKAARAYKEASDPLFAMRQALTEAQRASGLYGDAVKDNANEEKIYQAYLAKGIDLRKNATAAQLKEAQAMKDALKAQDKKDYTTQQVGNVVNPLMEDQKFLASKKDFFSEIDRLRQQDVIDEETAAKAKNAIQSKYDDLKLEGTRNVLDQVAQLSSSKNRELAAIGKAAAIAEATMDGYKAVQKALSSMPPPANYIAAAAVGVAAAANVAAIAGVPGFETGGYTGNGDRKEIAGVVHGKEYVFDADATARIGVGTLESIRRGMNISQYSGYSSGGYVGASPAPSYPNVNVSGGNVTVINATGEKVESKKTRNAQGGMDTQIIIGQIEKSLAAKVQSGDGPLAKSMANRFGLNPARGNAQ